MWDLKVAWIIEWLGMVMDNPRRCQRFNYFFPVLCASFGIANGVVDS
jgi:hypothetical protein